MKTAVIYWSGTGNTEEMAKAVHEGMSGSELFAVSNISLEKANEYDAYALGCPASGSEELEETEMEPFFEELEINGKPVALFGSYGWGGGDYMDEWKSRAEDKGAKITGTVTAEGSPDSDALEECRALGKSVLG